MQLSGKVLVTGGAGFLGRGIIHKARKEGWPCEITVFSRDETKQFEVSRRYPEVRCVLGDVRDKDRLEAVFSGYDTVVHAAAVKYIPEAEHNVLEAIAVNVEGSINVARAAVRAGVKTVVGVSTDKACSPLNTYGATKLLMERAFSEANRWGDTNFATVRYGNVVGSTGSVVPVFLNQIKDYGEIRITDSRMTRFWISISEAVELVEHAANVVFTPGTVVVPLCPAMTIHKLAEAVWHLEREDEPKIAVTGIRPGEKLHEALFNEQEAQRSEPSLDRNYVYIRSATSPVIIPDRSGYTSDCAEQIEVSRMVEMIREAQEVWL